MMSEECSRREIVDILENQCMQLVNPVLSDTVGIPICWYNEWKHHTSIRPGIIDNKSLLDEYGGFSMNKVGMVKWICAETWVALNHWYSSNAPPIRREDVKFTRIRSKSRSTSIYEDYDIPIPPVYWDITWRSIGSGTASGSNCCHVCFASPVSFCCGACKTVYYCDVECQRADWMIHKEQCLRSIPKRSNRGLTGLTNLGNTCYMNATIHCLSHCWPLTRYFLTNRFKQDRNSISKLGTGGRFALSWDMLLKESWLGSSSFVSPLNMKRAIGTLPGSGNQFSGYQQHDAQELLVFLLDTLHEDLNLVQVKPYFATDDEDTSSTTPIPRLAAESWMMHLKREHSMITNIFQGQLHNSVECPKCKYCSHTFSPFLFLPLAIPVDIDRVVVVTVMRSQQALMFGQACFSYQRTRFALSMHKGAKCISLKERIFDSCGLVPEKQWIVRVKDSLISEEYLDHSSINKILRGAGEVVCYELNQLDQEQSGREIVLLHRHSDEDTSFKYHGVPVILRFDAESSTTCSIRKQIALSLSQMKNGHDVCDEDDLLGRAQNLPLFLVNFDGSKLDNSEFPCLEEMPKQLKEDKIIFLALDWTALGNISQGSWTFNEASSSFALVHHESVLKYQEKLKRKAALRNKYQDEAYTLRECLNFFSNKEQLGSGDSWFCTSCKSSQRAFKRMNIIRLPEVLILSLKRFENGDSLFRNKLNAFVDFPFEGLDMAPYLAEYGGDVEKQDTLFDLFAVTNHHGAMGFGHYTAFAARQMEIPGPVRWFEFDDSSVTEVAPNDVQTTSAYVLYYKRRR